MAENTFLRRLWGEVVEEGKSWRSRCPVEGKAKVEATLVLVLTQGERLVEKHRLIKDDWKFLFVFSF